jgi:hypothetical protein
MRKASGTISPLLYDSDGGYRNYDFDSDDYSDSGGGYLDYCGSDGDYDPIWLVEHQLGRLRVEVGFSRRLPPPDDTHSPFGWAVLPQAIEAYAKKLIDLAPKLEASTTQATKAITAFVHIRFKSVLESFRAAMEILNDLDGHLDESEKKKLLAMIQQTETDKEVIAAHTEAALVLELNSFVLEIMPWYTIQFQFECLMPGTHGFPDRESFASAKFAFGSDNSNCIAFLLNSVTQGVDQNPEHLGRVVGCIVYRQWLDCLGQCYQRASANKAKGPVALKRASTIGSFLSKASSLLTRLVGLCSHLSRQQCNVLLANAKSLRVWKLITISITKADGETFELELHDCQLVYHVKEELSSVSGISPAVQEIYAVDGERPLQDGHVLSTLRSSHALLELLVLVCPGESFIFCKL